MPSVVIPPWLSTTPSDFAQAAEAGQRLGLERRGQDISQQEEQQKLGMSQAEMANNAALEQQKMQMQAAESAQQQAVERQRIQATQEIAANRLRLSTDAAARKFQQQQAYQQAIQSGMDPIQAMMKFGPTMGQSMSGVGQLGLMEAKNRMAEIPPKLITDPSSGLQAWHVPGERPIPVPKGKAQLPQKMSAGDAVDVDILKAKILSLTKSPQSMLIPGHENDLKNAEAELKKITSKYKHPVDNPPSEDETGDESGGSDTSTNEFNYDPATGKYEPAGGQ